MWNCCMRQVSLLVAVLYLVLGGLRLGWACEVLSKPIISAFLTAGAMIISLSQVRAPASRAAAILCDGNTVSHGMCSYHAPRAGPPPPSRSSPPLTCTACLP